MATSFTTTQITTFLDNIAKSLVDIEAVEVTSGAATLANVIAGQTGAANSLVARVAAATLDADDGNITFFAGRAAAAMVAAATNVASGYYPIYRDFLYALEADLGTIAQYCAQNGILVHPELANCINYFHVTGGDVAGVAVPLNPILPSQIFVPASQTLASVAVTGATAGTYSAGTALDTTKYAPSQLYLQNTKGATSGGTATSVTVTYTNAAGATGQTATQALSGAMAAGATLAIGSAVGQAVSNIVVNSGGVAADAFAVVLLPARTVAY